MSVVQGEGSAVSIDLLSVQVSVAGNICTFFFLLQSEDLQQLHWCNTLCFHSTTWSTKQSQPKFWTSIHIWKHINDSKQIYLHLSQADMLLNVYEITLFWPGLKQFLVLAAYFCPIAVVICASQPAWGVVQWSRWRTVENYYLDIWLLELLFW